MTGLMTEAEAAQRLRVCTRKPHYQYDFQFKGSRYYGPAGCSTLRAAETYAGNSLRYRAQARYLRASRSRPNAADGWRRLG